MVARSKTGNLGRPVKENLRLQTLLCIVQKGWMNIDPQLKGDWFAGHWYWTNRLDYSYPNQINSQNWYIIINFRLLNAGLPMNDDPPFEANPANVQAFSATQGNGHSIICSWTPTSNRIYLEIYLETGRTGQRVPFYKHARFKARPEGSAGTCTIQPWLPGWNNIHYSTLDKLTGLVSDFAPFTLRVI